ncbi:MAG: hypothetical protein ABSD31_11425 [Candidatus Binataceae bacterium]
MRCLAGGFDLRLMRLALLASILALLTVGSSGCIWLGVPELAYEGYKLDNNSSGDSSAQASSKQRKSTPATQQLDTSIE